MPRSLPLSAHTHHVPGRAVPRASCGTDPLLSVQVQFGFWLLRYCCTFMLFILGMKAPGLPRKPYMLLVNEEERDVENSQVSPRAGAVWGHGEGGGGDKVEIQLPWDQHLQEAREEQGLGLPKLPAAVRPCWEDGVGTLGGQGWVSWWGVPWGHCQLDWGAGAVTPCSAVP